MTNTTKLRKTSLRWQMLNELKKAGLPTEDQTTLELADRTARVALAEVEQAERAKEEQIKEDYIAWVFHNSYGERRQYKGKTPFAEWKEQAEVRDMSDWK